jgi:predicted secreted acid phosphatase
MGAIAVAAALSGALVPSAASAAPVLDAPARSVHAQALPPYATWVADVTVVTNQATAYLNGRLPDPSRKAAIVLDIDNTALETSYRPGLTSPANRPVLAVARLAKARGAAVFFVTARPELIRLITQHNLRSAGYEIDGLYMKRDFSSDQVHKTNARIAIERRGYAIVANIGNRDTDLAGGHAERTFKLPDYDGQLS